MARKNTKTTTTVNPVKEHTFHFNVRFLKSDSYMDDVTALCRWHIETLRHDSMVESVKGIVNALENGHAKIDAMKASDAVIREKLPMCTRRGRTYTPRDAENFIAKRKKIKEQETRADNENVLLTSIDDGTKVCSEMWPTLDMQDKNMIEFICRPNYRGFTTDASILNTGKNDADGKPVRYTFEKYIVDMYNGVSDGKLKSDLRPTFNNYLGKEGKLFKAVQLQKSGVDIWEVNHTMAGCGGTAKYNPDTGKFEFVCDTSDERVRKVLLDLGAVLYDKGAFVAKVNTQGKAEKTA